MLGNQSIPKHDFCLFEGTLKRSIWLDDRSSGKYVALSKPSFSFYRNSFLALLNWKLKWAFLITCCLSVRLSVCLSVRPSIMFSHFLFLLQNHSTDFKQTWHKAVNERDLSVYILRPIQSQNGFFSLNLCNGIKEVLRKCFKGLELFFRWAMWPVGFYFPLSNVRNVNHFTFD